MTRKYNYKTRHERQELQRDHRTSLLLMPQEGQDWHAFHQQHHYLHHPHHYGQPNQREDMTKQDKT